MDLKLPESLVRAREHERYAAEPDGLRPGHRVHLLIDGVETFPAMLTAIARARRYIHLETYILKADLTGRLFASALVERARAGVAVRLMYDAFGAFPISSGYLAELRQGGVEVLEYRPIGGRRWTWRRWLRRDHRKVLVVDGERAFLGGINIADEYSPRAVGGKGWRDTHAMVEGPVVTELEAMFRSTWTYAGGAPYAAFSREADESAAVPGSELAMALGSDDRGRRSVIRRHILYAMARAQRCVYISNAYFVPDRGLRRALRAAAARGIDVRLIVPGESDVRSVQWAGEYSFAGLLRAGVRIHRWFGSHMHAKTIVVDDGWSMVGSYNLDYMSLFWNMEVVLVVVGEVTARSMHQLYARDLEHCREVALEAWTRRSLFQRFLSWLAYRFRRFL